MIIRFKRNCFEHFLLKKSHTRSGKYFGSSQHSKVENYCDKLINSFFISFKMYSANFLYILEFIEDFFTYFIKIKN